MKEFLRFAENSSTSCKMYNTTVPPGGEHGSVFGGA